MNNNNEYRKYFNNISPDHELVEKTRKMMISELENSNSSGSIRRFSYKKCGIAVACSAVAAAIIFMSPGLFNHKTGDLTYVSDNHSAEIAVTSAYNSGYVTSEAVFSTAEREMTAPVSSDAAYASSSLKQEKTDVTTVSSVSENVQVFSENSEAAGISNVSETVKPSLTYPVPETRPSEVTENIISDEVTDKPVTSVSDVLVTTVPNYRPGASSSTEAASEVTVCPQTPENIFWRQDKVEYNGNVYDLFINQEFDYSFPRLMDKDIISFDNAEEYFGSDFCPEFIRSSCKDQNIAVSDKNDPGAGIIMFSGKQTDLSDRTSKFISVSVSERETDLMYKPDNMDEMKYSDVNGAEIMICQLVQYQNVYICLQNKNGYLYSYCFKGYSTDEIISIIFS